MEGGAIPRWWGIAWQESAVRGYVCYPLGLHLLFRWARDLYWWLARGRRDKALLAAYRVGYDDGGRRAYFDRQAGQAVVELLRWREWADNLHDQAEQDPDKPVTKAFAEMVDAMRERTRTQ